MNRTSEAWRAIALQ